jgi:hypothetical protein
MPGCLGALGAMRAFLLQVKPEGLNPEGIDTHGQVRRKAPPNPIVLMVASWSA